MADQTKTEMWDPAMCLESAYDHLVATEINHELQDNSVSEELKTEILDLDAYCKMEAEKYRLETGTFIHDCQYENIDYNLVSSHEVKQNSEDTGSVYINNVEPFKRVKDASFVCVYCNKTFFEEQHLTDHSVVHTGQTHFTCNVCEKPFHKKKYRDAHMMIHKGQLFACDICNKTFSVNRYLKRHMSIHSGQKPFACELCDKSFLTKTQLTRHSLCHTESRALRENTSEISSEQSWSSDVSLPSEPGGSSMLSLGEENQDVMSQTS